MAGVGHPGRKFGSLNYSTTARHGMCARRAGYSNSVGIKRSGHISRELAWPLNLEEEVQPVSRLAMYQIVASGGEIDGVKSRAR